METKRLIWVTILSVSVMFLWTFGSKWVGEKMGYDMSPPPQGVERAPVEVVPGDSTTDAAPDGPNLTSRPATQGGQGGRGGGLEAAGKLRVLAAAEGPRTIELGSGDFNDPTYALRLTVTNVGAGIDEALLNDFKQKVDAPARYVFQEPYARSPNASRPLATNRVTVGGESVDLSKIAWNVDDAQTDAGQAVFYVEIGDADGRPVARVEKLFKVYPRVAQDGDTRAGYEVLVRQSIRNLADAPLTAATSVNGPVTPPRELESGYDRTIIVGYRGRNGTVDYTGFQAESFHGKDRQRQLLKGGAGGAAGDEPPLLWAGASTVYFDAVVRPMPLTAPQAGGVVPAPAYLKAVTAQGTNPDKEDPGDIDRVEPNVTMAFETSDFNLAAAGDESNRDVAEVPFRVLFAPKSREILKSDYYASAAMRYDDTLRSPFGCTWFVFSPVVDSLVFLLTLFHTILRDWGLAIIALVVVVRSLLHPITKRSQRSMMRMTKLGPEMERLKKKYGDDKDAMSKAMGEFYREHGLAALPLGCLPMFLQTPIWIALYSTLQAEFRLRHAPFLQFFGIHFTWIDDLARPDNLVDFGRPLSLIFFTIHGINLLPLLLAGVFFVQMKFQPQPVATTPEQETQQKLMKWVMVLMFPLFLYKAPSGLCLYIITSTAIGIWESKRIRAQLKAEEDAKAAAPQIVEATGGGNGRKGSRGGAVAVAAPPTGLRGRFAEFQRKLQEQVENAQKDAGKRPRKR